MKKGADQSKAAKKSGNWECCFWKKFCIQTGCETDSGADRQRYQPLYQQTNEAPYTEQFNIAIAKKYSNGIQK